MISKIDAYSFEKYFQLFKSLVESKSQSAFVSFSANRYTEDEEGYKDKIYEKARNNLRFWEWKKEDIGSGGIIRSVVSAIKLDENNLIDWRVVSKFENKINDNNKFDKHEKALFNFFHNLSADEESFNLFVEYFGKNYSLNAYLFFVKDKAQYMPISPINFDIAFDKLGIKNFKTSYQCSWSNYQKYNSLLNQVRILLTNKGVKDVSLLNAHSFVWIISDIENQLSEAKILDRGKLDTINQYYELKHKDKETIVKARNGQGMFRSWLIEYWEKGSITGCNKLKLLIASHIKPWKDCDNKEAIDVFNGLLLTPNIDKLFDIGMISFDDKGQIIISSELNNNDLKVLGVNECMRMNKIEQDHKKYLRYHRERILRK